ncbi:hypothetical protein GCM10010168_22750 [Actinoplanes ianthinogenes]|uniref:Uncharacterized protein n=1 Tax=Actinoplanes ianthinogenes TaxID=122358 RepID=A0ABM7M8F0_9ACTN|nr:hypothetical protein [Actinoplanes ianthinogenes]BCJ47916.1 hypothetical protein Aiant_85730 [Actinoplanes ianthinogenes]GGR05066.1 hypothetical protein GCM10010168_22750 [Actinoplanes ianthinogenes]
MYRILGSAAAGAFALALAAPAAAAVADPQTAYTMHLSKSAVTIQAGGRASNFVTFTVIPKLEDTRVNLTATGLPDGVTARFFPAKPFLAATSILSLNSTSSALAGTFTVTVSAITISSDPIGDTETFSLTVTGG